LKEDHENEMEVNVKLKKPTIFVKLLNKNIDIDIKTIKTK
jgi:hypothetical protein